MALTKKAKSEVMKKYAATEKDTGSPQVQIALLSTRITFLTEHLKTHKKDISSRVGLLKLVGQRRRLLTYLQGKDEKAFKKLKKDLSL